MSGYPPEGEIALGLLGFIPGVLQFRFRIGKVSLEDLPAEVPVRTDLGTFPGFRVPAEEEPPGGKS